MSIIHEDKDGFFTFLKGKKVYLLPEIGKVSAIFAMSRFKPKKKMKS